MFRKTPPSEPRQFTDGTSGATADAAPDGKVRDADKDSGAPHARPAERLGAEEIPDQLADRQAEDRQEALLDEGVEETFPASDPVSAKHIT